MVLRLFMAAAWVVVFGGCSQPADTASTDTLLNEAPFVVMTTFYPTQYFTMRIGGDRVEVVCPVPQDEDAIFWTPSDDVIKQYQDADLIVLNGAGFAKWVDHAVLPQSRTVNTAKPFASEFIRYESATTHRHGPSGEHAHEGVDGHTWMDPNYAIVQSGEILKAMVLRLPQYQTEFEQRYAALVADLKALDRQLLDYSAHRDHDVFFASHPAYNYLARRYGWKVINLNLAPEEMPSDETFEKIASMVHDQDIRFLVWESEPKREIATRMKEVLGVQSLVFSPCELLSDDAHVRSEDYMRVMQRNLAHLAPVFME